jgi:hypothetical protein
MLYQHIVIHSKKAPMLPSALFLRLLFSSVIPEELMTVSSEELLITYI